MLRQVAEWSRVVVDTAVDGVVLIDAVGSIRVFNPACERLFGYTSDEMLGQNVRVLMPPPYRDEHDGYLRNYQRTHERKIIGIGREVMARRKDGSVFPIELSVGEATHDGSPLYVGTIHDISERKQAEEQRKQFLEALIASNEERGHFSYVASHDLQEHLRMVLSFGALLLEEYGAQLDDKARQYLTLSLQAANQMRELVGDLLDYGRLGTEVDRVRLFDASAETALVLEVLNDVIRGSGAAVAIDPLPKVIGNPVRFRRLVQNLIVNAVKFTGEKTTPCLRVSAADIGTHWRFCIKDNGIGIAEAYREKIFAPFRRLHSKAQYPGTGLGLTICKKIVQDFGGKIWVESEPGIGSSFYFTMDKKEPEQ